MNFRMKLSQIADVVQGTVLSGEENLLVRGLGTDTREDLKGQLFVALKGESYDAHEFLEHALEKGAIALLVNCETFDSEALATLLKVQPSLGVITIDDPLKGLQKLAKAWRKQCGFKVIAISGSNGKTTTKEFLKTFLSKRHQVVASPKSFNNHLGVPLSLLMGGPETEFAVIEMGMNHSGELAELCKMAEPDLTLVTMVGQSHIGNLGSIEAIAKEKAAIYESSPGSIKVFNEDNEHTLNMLLQARQFGTAQKDGLKKLSLRQFFFWNSFKKNSQDNGRVKKIWTFSSQKTSADVFMRVKTLNLHGLEISGHVGGQEFSANVPVFGGHNISNLMSASCLALACGLKAEDIIAALPECKTTWGRNEYIELKNGASVIFDAYNANFESTSSLIDNLLKVGVKGKKYAVFGQMLELGHESGALHRKLGQRVAGAGFERVWFLGSEKEAFEEGLRDGGFQKKIVVSNTYKEELARDVGSMLHSGDVVVIKGSRGMRLERVLETLRDFA